MPDGYEKLIRKIRVYDKTCNFDLIEKAYHYAKTAHEGQFRASGEPYIIHPIAVATILTELEAESTTIVAAILHDTIEDTDSTFEDIKANFGEEVAILVDGVTKLGQIPYNSKVEQQVENLRKMFLAMARDIRVIVIKLADRLHNMRTLGSMAPDKQLSKAKETIEIYAPLSHRLGISKIKWELEDLCLKYIDKVGYTELQDKVAKKRKEREDYVNQIMSNIILKTKELNIASSVDGRAKHFYSIYKKMKNNSKTFEEIYDIFAVRVIVNSVKDCYAVLGLVHELYKPMPGRFKDYIAMPKPNMYQSLHSTIIGPDGQPFEVQLRTWDMHRIAEVGIAAHWKYKEGAKTERVDNKFQWLSQLLDWQKDMKDANEFMENLKVDLFTDEVFIFTPRGDVLSLRKGSTPIDFAYAIHSAVGNKMMGAKANGKIVTLDYELKNGDIIEILTSSSVHGPSLDWMNIVKTSQAKNKINQWFKKEKREENIVKGKEIVEKELKKQGFTFQQLFKQDWLEKVYKKYTFNAIEDMYASIGFGAITANKIITKLKEDYKKTLKPEELEELKEKLVPKKEKPKKSQPEDNVVVKDIKNCLVRFSKCCNPVPGDEIVGYITKGRGVSIHRTDCININNSDQKRSIEVSWYQKDVKTIGKTTYKADISILGNDRSALLSDIVYTIDEAKIDVVGVSARKSKDKRIAVLQFSIEIKDSDQLEKIIRKIKKIDSVFEVTRTKL